MNLSSISLNQLPHLDLKPTQLKKLEKLGISNILDLLHYYPRDHVIYRVSKIAEAKLGEAVTVVGKIQQHRIFTARNGKLTVQAWTIANKADSATLTCTHFHNHIRYQAHQWRSQQCSFYRVGRIVMLSGKIKQDSYSGGKAIDAAEVKVVDLAGIASSIKEGAICPVYALTKGISADLLQECLRATLEIAALPDPLPSGLRERYGLVELKQAIAHIHFPPNASSLEAARRRLVFDEFFYLQLGLLQRRQVLRQLQREALDTQGSLLEQFYQILPFPLTQAQQRVIAEILDDLTRPHPMNRLVQGDVGSGKTVVAVAALLAAIQSGYQAALMAPTEVLAEQHYQKISQWFDCLHLPVALLTGSTPTAQRRTIHAHLKAGRLALIIGTHALIQDAVRFQHLGLVVIDEQHRFGVSQRSKLQQKGIYPHTLSMTATPIPRTLALTVHGDLDVSWIDELPPGRKPILTRVISDRHREKAYEAIHLNLVIDRQAYIILPLVEASENLDLRSVIQEHKRLQQRFPGFRVGLLHGRMNRAEKAAAIAQFRDNQTQVLVSTTVVEVGVDVPNATVIIVEHAERFGLAQLHQLRGRVGRGDHPSYCYLINTAQSEESERRLKVLERSQDGFFIAERDLQLRGPGEVLGTTQAGLPDLALADLVEDQDLLLLAREAAEQVIDRADRLKCWKHLAAELQRRYDLQPAAC